MIRCLTVRNSGASVLQEIIVITAELCQLSQFSTMYTNIVLISIAAVKQKFDISGEITLQTEDGTEIDEGESLNVLPENEKVFVVKRQQDERLVHHCIEYYSYRHYLDFKCLAKL